MILPSTTGSCSIPGSVSPQAANVASDIAVSLVVELAATSSRNMIQVLIALQTASLDGLSGPASSGTSTIPPSRATTATTSTLISSASAVVWSGAELSTVASHASAANGAAARALVSHRVPSTSLHTAKQGRKVSVHVETWDNHAIHREVLEVESSGSSLCPLAVWLREVPIGIGIRSGRSDMSRINDIGIDEFKLSTC